MKKLLFIIVLLLGLGFGGKLLVEQQYKSALDKFSRQVSPFMNFDYRDLKIEPNGSLLVTGLSLSEADSSDVMSIQELRVNFHDPMFLVLAKQRIKKRDFPPKVSVKLVNADMPVSMYESKVKGAPCRDLVSTFNYSKAGFNRLNGDMDLQFDFSNPAEASVYLRSSDQTAIISADVEFDPAVVTRGASMDDDLPIDFARLEYELKEDAANAFLDYCAGVFKVGKETFLNQVVGSAKYSDNSFGLDVGDDVREALKQFMQGGKQLTIEVDPGGTLTSPSQFKLYEPAQVAKMLNMNMQLDGETIPLDKLKESEPEEEAKVEEPEYKFVKASLSNSAKHIGQQIKIKRAGDRDGLEGRLLSVKDGVLEVQIYRYGGVMVYNIPFGKVKRFEVLTRQ